MGVDLKILVIKGVVEALGRLAAGEVLTSKGFRELGVSEYARKRLMGEGLIEVKSEEVLVREEKLKIKRTLYELTDKGRTVLKLYRTLGDALKITEKQIEILDSLSEGPRTRRQLPNRYCVDRLVRRGFVKRSKIEREEPRKVYGKTRIYRITEKGKKAYKLYKNLKSL